MHASGHLNVSDCSAKMQALKQIQKLMKRVFGGAIIKVYNNSLKFIIKLFTCEFQPELKSS